MQLQQLQSRFRQVLFQQVIDEGLPIEGKNNENYQILAYQNNLYNSLYKNLADKFKMTKKLLGEEVFFACAKEYIFTEPQTSAYLCEYGEKFPNFIEDPLGKELANLEWCMNLSLIRYTKESVLELEELFFVHPNLMNGFIFRLHSSVQLYESSYALKDIWVGLKANKMIPAYRYPSYFFIATEDQRSFFFSLQKDEYDFLKMMQEGKSVGEIYNYFSDSCFLQKMLSQFISYYTEVKNKPF